MSKNIYEINMSFVKSCREGNLREAQNIIKTFDNINIHIYKELAFRESCLNGHLEVAKWLVETFNNINIHIYNERAFRSSCLNGHYEVAKWLIDFTSDVRHNDDIFIKIAFEDNHIEIVKYLCSICPYYKLSYDNNKKCFNYVISEYLNIKSSRWR